ncbi:soluble lytic murein transglycosylase-like protein [Pleurocapsa sp. PCC 7327]|uniref:lytic transglycosylase domain-containing protein n=1 Tax=Pleurocapsa sp. PCC 7327 TaxID=118163 RepID=UPI00029F9C25|nr:transglycosylase SLT domain-containing protein [Pleurocapsa sp. PCC 7327]AFY78215.1 soluble lytic murein transglycosylase-like protein [Pleurocapsa sp. PCC 7327]
MPKQRINPTYLLSGSGALLLALLGSVWLNPQAVDWIEQRTSIDLGSERTSHSEELNRPSAVLNLTTLPAQERESQLKEIASSGKSLLDRSRARYLLASDLIKKYEGGLALQQLEGLEDKYPVLAPYIFLKRGRAYELTNETQQATETWQKLLETYPQSPIAAEALYKLGQSNPEYWDRAIAQFPQHPRTHDIIRERLKKNPKQPQLMLLLVKYDPDGEGSNAIRDRLVKEFGKQLKPENWSMIAAGYWETAEYKKAAQAYTKATPTPESAYRLARSLQLSDKIEEAKKAYQQLIQRFPNAEETGLGLRRLASLSKPQEAVKYLDRVTNKFPKETPEALLEKAKLFDTLNNQKAASQARQKLLSQYAKSNAAAEYRWQIAQQYADARELVKAWQWAQPIATNNAESPLAPKATFWIGKWAQQLGRQQDAKAAFEHVLARHPQSYYAWRAAVLLGWNVGNFNNVRQMQPTLVKPTLRPMPTAGSETFRELYRLGLNDEAWTLFRAEVRDPWKLTVDEQFTKGLLKLAQGKHLQGINNVGTLRDRKDPQDRSQWQALRQKPEYWYALFPFPFYQSILSWSQQRQLNPVLVTSLIRQESRFETDIRSPVGAVGLMQVMPETGEWIAKQLQLKEYSLTDPQDNIKLGTWYLDHTHQEYDNNSLLAIASYNAGPGNVAQWLERYRASDPDVFVEKIPFRETKGYVESVFGNYWNYLRIYDPEIANLLAQYTDQPFNPRSN